MADTMEKLDRIMATIRALPTREKAHYTNWEQKAYDKAMERDPKSVVLVRLICDTKANTMMREYAFVPKGTFVGVVLRWLHIPFIEGAHLFLNGEPCNLAARVQEEHDTILYIRE